MHHQFKQVLSYANKTHKWFKTYYKLKIHTTQNLLHYLNKCTIILLNYYPAKIIKNSIILLIRYSDISLNYKTSS